ncbi:bile acid:sodium symporter family protein [Novosphingobium sp.]|uniref:bile acid:sodium symporter family protein n=1 Tax=Novosphingobium sp. TaxID=1874826 RepID=UPI00263025B6|nr:bile acid:sodium symporter family protein [Novosphingobium sp.]
MAARIKLPTVDPFLMWLVSCVVAASVLPARGAVLTGFDWAANAAIVLLFFLHGAKLSREAVLAGIGHWRLHLMTLAFTYVLFPVLGLVAQAATGQVIDPTLAMGLLFLALLPSTVQSSIAMTAMAGGNVAAAVCSASLSNLIGVVLTPLLVTVFIHGGGGGAGGGMDGLASAEKIATQLLLPFVVGHLLRPVIGKWVDSHKKLLQPVDRSSVLLVVYSAFSAAVVNGVWQRVGPFDLAVLLAASGAMLAVVIAINGVAARAAGLAREDAIVLLFCGSKKSLVSGVPMAGALFAPAQVGIVILPLMIFHQLQLFVCAWLAGRWRREGEALAAAAAAATLPPQDEAAMLARASEIGLPVPEECRPGVSSNLALLTQHARIALGEGGA